MYVCHACDSPHTFKLVELPTFCFRPFIIIHSSCFCLELDERQRQPGTTIHQRRLALRLVGCLDLAGNHGILSFFPQPVFFSLEGHSDHIDRNRLTRIGIPPPSNVLMGRTRTQPLPPLIERRLRAHWSVQNEYLVTRSISGHLAHDCKQRMTLAWPIRSPGPLTALFQNEFHVEEEVQHKYQISWRKNILALHLSSSCGRSPTHVAGWRTAVCSTLAQ
jgi:hypothetical protein